MHKIVTVILAVSLVSCTYTHSHVDMDGVHDETNFSVASPFELVSDVIGLFGKT